MDKIVRNVIIIVSVVLIITAIFAVLTLSNNGVLTGSTTSVNTNSASNNDANTNSPPLTTDVQNVKLTVSGGTYILTPSVLKKDVPVRMEVDLKTVRGCATDIVISAFNVRKYVKQGDNIIMFTPTKTGTINIACSMNMYRGTFIVE